MKRIGQLYYRWFDSSTEKPSDKWDYVNLGISKITNHKATHVGICINETETDYIMFESTFKSTEIRLFDKGWFNNKIKDGTWVWQQVKGLDVTDLNEKAEALKDIKYSYFDYIKFLVFYYTGLRLFPGSLKRMVCSESIALILSLQGIDLGLYDNIYKFDYISPGKLYDAVEAFNGGLTMVKDKHINIKVEEEKEYSYIIGCWKSIKNNLIVYGAPALLYLVNNYAEWMPKESVVAITPLMGFLSYMIKNKLQFKQ